MKPLQPCFRALVLVSTALLSLGCRGFQVDGASLADLGVLGRTTLTSSELAAREYVSTNTSLEPLEGALDRGVGADIDILAMTFTSRPNGRVTFLRFDTAEGARSTISRQPSSPLPYDPIRIGPLINEASGFFGPTLAGLRAVAPAGAVPPAIRFPSVPDTSSLRTYLDRMTLEVPGGRNIAGGIETFWAMPNDRELPNVPVLVIRTRFNVADGMNGDMSPFLTIDITGATFDLRVQPILCDLEGRSTSLPRCAQSGGRAGVFFGYTAPGQIESAPDINLDLGFSAEVSLSSYGGPGPLCFFTGAPECFTPGYYANEVANEIRERLKAIGDAVAIATALAPGLPNLRFTTTTGTVIDVGSAPLTVRASMGFGSFTAPFGAVGGLWGDPALVGLSRGFSLSVAGAMVGSTTPLPNLARVQDFAPYFAHEMRRIFAEPILRAASQRRIVTSGAGSSRPTAARIRSITAEQVSGGVRARFAWSFDADGDGIDDDGDSCPDVPDVLNMSGRAPDRDGDGLFDSCDLCAGNVGSASRQRRDIDADGRGSACDCDDDADMCPDHNRGGAAGTGSCVLREGMIVDRWPGIASTLDTDRDEIPNDCDPDSDNDFIADEQDNCPLHFNPDQRDSGGTRPMGDACDPLCRRPGCSFLDLPVTLP